MIFVFVSSFSFHFKTEERSVSMSMLGFIASGKMAARWLHKFFERSCVTLFFSTDRNCEVSIVHVYMMCKRVCSRMFACTLISKV